MALYWGVEPIMMPYVNSTDELVSRAVESAEAAGLVKRGDLVVVTAGVPVGVSGTTNMIRIQQVGGALLNAVGIGSRRASGPLCVCRYAGSGGGEIPPRGRSGAALHHQ